MLSFHLSGKRIFDICRWIAKDLENFKLELIASRSNPDVLERSCVIVYCAVEMLLCMRLKNMEVLLHKSRPISTRAKRKISTSSSHSISRLLRVRKWCEKKFTICNDFFILSAIAIRTFFFIPQAHLVALFKSARKSKFGTLHIPVNRIYLCM